MCKWSRIAVISILLCSCVTLVSAEEPEQETDKSEQETAAKSSSHTAHLKSGKLGEHPDAVDGKKRVWPHKLPFFGQKVTDLGFDLPNPYGVALLAVWLEQDVALSDLRVKITDGPGEPQEVPFVEIATSDVQTITAEGKFDFWLLPFLNVFAFVGHIDGEAFVPVAIPGEAMLKALLPNEGARCDDPPGTPLRPELCDQAFIILDNTNYSGTNVGGGLALAAGFGRWFVALPFSYSESNLSNTNDFVHAFQGSFRFGFHAPYRKDGMFSVYVGTTYLDTEQDITGTVPLESISFDYTIHQEAAEAWNYLAGFNWTITPKWWFQAEFGFGGTRKNLITSINYRW